MESKGGKRFTINYDTKLTTVEKVQLNNQALVMIETTDPGFRMGDAYHTIEELYDHRRALTIGLWHALDFMYRNLPLGVGMIHPKVFKSKNHHPESDPMFPGYFVVFCTIAELNGRWTCYHYSLKHWDEFRVREAPHSPLYPLDFEPADEFFSNVLNFDKKVL